MEKHIIKDIERMPQALSWTNPFQAVENWFEDMEHRWLTPSTYLNARLPSSYLLRSPRLDIIERDDEIHVRAELPGIDKNDLSISVQGDLLTIQANLSQEEKEEKGRFYRRELVQGSYQRTVQLPTPVVPEKAEAKFRHGVMELTLPKKPGFEPRHIPIQ